QAGLGTAQRPTHVGHAPRAAQAAGTRCVPYDTLSSDRVWLIPAGWNGSEAGWDRQSQLREQLPHRHPEVRGHLRKRQLLVDGEAAGEPALRVNTDGVSVRAQHTDHHYPAVVVFGALGGERRT